MFGDYPRLPDEDPDFFWLSGTPRKLPFGTVITELFLGTGGFLLSINSIFFY
jgi:hypothetical protein